MQKLLTCSLLFLLWQNISYTQGYNKYFDFGYPGNSFGDIVIYNDTIVGIGEAFSDWTLTRQGIFLVQLDSNGNLLQKKIYLDTLGDNFFLFPGPDKIVKCTDGGYAFVAASYERNDAYLYKLDAGFNVEFIKEYRDTVNIANFPYSIIETPEGYLLYGLNVTPAITQFGFMRMVDKQGEQLWEKRFPQTIYSYGAIHAVRLADSNYLFSSYLFKSGESQYTFTNFRVLNAAGNQVASWQNDINDSLGFVSRVLPLDDGGFMAVGQAISKPPPFPKYKPSYIRFKPGFQVDWVRYWGPPKFVLYEPAADCSKLLRTGSNTVLAFGERYDYEIVANNTFGQAYFQNFNLQGDSVWNRPVRPPDPLFNLDLPVTLYGAGVLSSGSIIGSGEITPDIYYAWLIKLTRDGCLDTLFACTPTSVTSVPLAPQSGTLTVAPNPAYGQARILFPESIHQGQLTVLDAVGRVRFQQTIRMGAGNYPLDVSGYPAGLYHALLEGTDGARWTGRFLVSGDD
jgi:hypothetical protein